MLLLKINEKLKNNSFILKIFIKIKLTCKCGLIKTDEQVLKKFDKINAGNEFFR